MKLLIDQNLSRYLVLQLAVGRPESPHVSTPQKPSAGERVPPVGFTFEYAAAVNERELPTIAG